MNVYKVVRSTANGYVSSFASGYWTLAYKIGKTTRPRVGKILAFDDPQDAQGWQGPGEIILECKATDVEKIDYLGHSGQDETWEAFWRSGHTEAPVVTAPFGTVACSSVMPLREVT